MRGDSILVTNWANGLWTPRDKQVEKLVAGMHRTMAALYIYIASPIQGYQLQICAVHGAARSGLGLGGNPNPNPDRGRRLQPRVGGPGGGPVLAPQGVQVEAQKTCVLISLPSNGPLSKSTKRDPHFV